MVAACNTASSLAMTALRERHPSVPIFEVITPACEWANEQSHSKNIGVLATRATILSGAYQKKLRALGAKIITGVPAPLLVPLIEEGWLEDEETKHIVSRYLRAFDSSIDTLILGCTHYPLIEKLISDFFKKITIISSGAAVAKAIQAYLSVNTEIVQSLDQKESRRYFSTDVSLRQNAVASEWMKEPIQFEKIILE